jgi:hypothetical protein
MIFQFYSLCQQAAACCLFLEKPAPVGVGIQRHRTKRVQTGADDALELETGVTGRIVGNTDVIFACADGVRNVDLWPLIQTADALFLRNLTELSNWH